LHRNGLEALFLQQFKKRLLQKLAGTSYTRVKPSLFWQQFAPFVVYTTLFGFCLLT
jgi:hypothetical protein